MSTLHLSPAVAKSGDRIAATGTGFPPQAQVLLRWNSTIVGSVVADANGGITTTFTVPNDVVSGKQIVRTAVASSGAAAVTVTASASPVSYVLLENGKRVGI